MREELQCPDHEGFRVADAQLPVVVAFEDLDESVGHSLRGPVQRFPHQRRSLRPILLDNIGFLDIHRLPCFCQQVEDGLHDRLRLLQLHVMSAFGDHVRAAL